MDYKRITPQQRDMMLFTLDGEPHETLRFIVYHIYCHVRCTEILHWLIRNRLTGKSLLGWFTQVHDGSILNMIAFVIKEIDRDLEKKPMFAGKDFY
jgi:hypothetical protein